VIFRIFWKELILLLLLFSDMDAVAQYLQIDPSFNITKEKGDDLSPSWSKDGQNLVFQSNREGNWDIYLFEVETGITERLTNDTANEQYPVLLQKNDRLAFTSDKTGNDQLYFLNINDGKQNLIFDREIPSKASSFPFSEYQLYCLGFNESANKWGIYRYEFKYNSLRFIKSLTDDSSIPRVSNEGEFILYEEMNQAKRTREINIINWYGGTVKVISGFNSYDASWAPGGLKIIFVSDMDNREGELYTIWKDGKHLERLTNDGLTVRNPVISPDNKKLAVSVLFKDGFEIFIIPFEDY